ncbi:MAG: riboflavin synthase [Gemmatimonadota bacterium]
MFTGIVETQGIIRDARARGEGLSFTIEAPDLTQALSQGDSVAVDGTCLTVEDLQPGAFVVTAVAATLARTVAGVYRVGSTVNLERAARVGDRLDGHLVQGHVDGTGVLVSSSGGVSDRLLRFQIPATVWSQTVPQGSIAINGVSLTVQAMQEPDGVAIAIIPYTWDHTNLGRLEPGDAVNVEGDLIAKYVGRMLAPHLGGAANATVPSPQRAGGSGEGER